MSFKHINLNKVENNLRHSLKWLEMENAGCFMHVFVL